jgi:hypothetical protein
MKDLNKTIKALNQVVEMVRDEKTFKGKQPTFIFIGDNKKDGFSVVNSDNFPIKELFKTNDFKTDIYKHNFSWSSELAEMLKSNNYCYYILRNNVFSSYCKGGTEKICFINKDEYLKLTNNFFNNLMINIVEGKKIILKQEEMVFLKMYFYNNTIEEIGGIAEKWYFENILKDF